MNTLIPKWNMLLFVALFMTQYAFAQDNVSEEIRFDVRSVDPPLSISQHQVKEAKRLGDLNNEANELDLYYKPSWIHTYEAVEIEATYMGVTQKGVSKSDILTFEQQELIQNADPGTPINVKIQYLPDNTLAHNDVKSLDFELNVKPLKDAGYPGGQQKMNDYLTRHVIHKIRAGSFLPTDFAAVQFTISETGEVTNAQVFEPGYQLHPPEKANAILLEAVRQMPAWQPAEYCKGTTLSQNYVVVVGNLESCLNNLISVGRD